MVFGNVVRKVGFVTFKYWEMATDWLVKVLAAAIRELSLSLPVKPNRMFFRTCSSAAPEKPLSASRPLNGMGEVLSTSGGVPTPTPKMVNPLIETFTGTGGDE